jgi:predicted transcriptional regulator
MKSNKKLIKQFKSWRLQLNITQAKLGAKLGTSRYTIADYETGRTRIPADHYLQVQALADAKKRAQI